MDQEEYNKAGSSTTKTNNKIEQMKVPTEPEIELDEAAISKQIEAAKKKLADLITKAEGKAHEALSVGKEAAADAQSFAVKTEKVATIAETEYRKIVNSAVQEKENLLTCFKKKEQKINEILPFAILKSTVDNAYKEASRVALQAAAAKEALKHVENTAWLFKATEALRTDGETRTVDAAAKEEKNAVEEALKAIEEYKQAEENLNSAIKTAVKQLDVLAAKNEAKQELQKQISTVLEIFKRKTQKADKVLKPLETAAKEAELAVAQVATAWLTLKKSVDAQTQEKAANSTSEKKRRKDEKKGNEEGTNPTRQYEQHDTIENIGESSMSKTAKIMLASLIFIVGTGFLTYGAFEIAAFLEAQAVLAQLAEPAVRNFHLDEPPNEEPIEGPDEPQNEEPIEGPDEPRGAAEQGEVFAEAADIAAGVAEEQAHLAANAAGEAEAAAGEAEAAAREAVAARENAEVRADDLRIAAGEVMEAAAEVEQAALDVEVAAGIPRAAAGAFNH